VVKHDTLEDGKFPIWAAVELLDFGNISRLFAGLDEPVATAVANEFGGGARFMKGVVWFNLQITSGIMWRISQGSGTSTIPRTLPHLRRYCLTN